MALEARHHNQYSPQIISNIREFVKTEEAKLKNPVQMASASPFATTVENPWLGMNHQYMGMNNMVIPPQTNLELPGNLPNDPSKRSIESVENQFNNLNMPPLTNDVLVPGFAPQSNFPHDVQHLWDIDYILTQFNKDINLEVETQADRELKYLLASITSMFVKRVKTQSEKISRLAKLNMLLQEKVKSLSAETQFWKDAAKNAELTNMCLRREFDELLGKLNKPSNDVGVEEDAESCYATSDFGKNDQVVDQGGSSGNRMCKKCRGRESSVLLLPCRHLCLCGVCGSSVQASCPVCDTCMTATVHVCLT